MSDYKNFTESNMDTIGSDWQKHIVEVNQMRKKIGLAHKIFSEKDKRMFELAWVEDHCP